MNEQHDQVNFEEMTEALRKSFPQAFEQLATQLELLTGKKAGAPLMSVDFKGLPDTLRRLLDIVTKLEKLGKLPSTPENSVAVYHLVNEMMRISMRSPKSVDPLERLILQAHKMCDMPKNLNLPPGLDYHSKHMGVLAFAQDVVQEKDKEAIDALVEEAISHHHLVPQFQRVVSRMALPKVLSTPLGKVSLRSAERVKTALRGVSADWESWVNLVYCMQLVHQGKPKTWSQIRDVSLGDKVSSVRKDPHLVGLAKEEWVTVRNSLDHGQAYFDPRRATLEFPDKVKQVSWPFDQAVQEGRDMFLANCAMMRLLNFLWVIPILRIEPWVAKTKASLAGGSAAS